MEYSLWRCRCTNTFWISPNAGLVKIFRLRGMEPAGDQRGELHDFPLETPMLESPPQAAG